MKPAPPVTSWRTGLLDVHLAVVADHQAQGAGPDPRPLHERLPADQAVLEPGDVEHLRVVHHDGVLDLAVDDLAAGADGAERPDEAVHDPRPGADGDRAAQRRVDD